MGLDFCRGVATLGSEPVRAELARVVVLTAVDRVELLLRRHIREVATVVALGTFVGGLVPRLCPIGPGIHVDPNQP